VTESSVEGLQAASNGGKGVAISEAGSIDEINGYETVGISEQGKDNIHAQIYNAAYNEEDRMVLEAGHDISAREDNLMLEDGFGLIDASEAPGQGGEHSIIIDLGDPSSFPPLHGGLTGSLIACKRWYRSEVTLVIVC